MPLRLYLIRHGETAWSLTRQHTGTSEIPLTENGIDQALELGPRLADISFTHILTSPRERARHTCKLAGLEGIAETEPDLAEWNYGDYEGVKSADIRQDRPNWDVFRDGCPQGETPDQVLARVDRLIARLRLLDGNVALFSHGQFGGILGARWIGLPLADARHFPLGTASISSLGYDPDHPEVSVISLWNFISHPISNPMAADHGMKKQAISRWENEGGKIA
jgi:broad specificity phosphatase PhoE